MLAQADTNCCDLCRRHGPIWPKLEQHSHAVPTCQDMSATFPAKAVLANKPTEVKNANKAANKAAKAAKWDEEKKRNATTCPHCNRKHPNRTHEQCWELPINAAKRPAEWKSVKSTLRCKGPSVMSKLQHIVSKVNQYCTYTNTAIHE